MEISQDIAAVWTEEREKYENNSHRQVRLARFPKPVVFIVEIDLWNEEVVTAVWETPAMHAGDEGGFFIHLLALTLSLPSSKTMFHQPS